MKKIPVICYKTKTPTVYNRGTRYEKTCDTFLAGYGEKTPEENKAFVKELNSNPEKFAQYCAEMRIPVHTVAYFYHYEQEPFDTMGD